MRDGLDHMNLRAPESSRSFVAKWWWVKWAGVIFLVGFLGSTAFRAVMAAFDSDRFPEALLVKVEALPFIFPLHMVTGGLALLLVPLALVLRGTRLHKWAGRVAVADIAIAGVTAIPVALTSPVTAIAAAGFATQGVIWLVLIAKGVWHIKRRQIRQHQSAMLMMAAVTSGAMFFRIYLALWALYGTGEGFKTFYSLDAWIAWALPLAITTVVITRPFPFAKREYVVPVK